MIPNASIKCPKMIKEVIMTWGGHIRKNRVTHKLSIDFTISSNFHLPVFTLTWSACSSSENEHQFSLQCCLLQNRTFVCIKAYSPIQIEWKLRILKYKNVLWCFDADSSEVEVNEEDKRKWKRDRFPLPRSFRSQIQFLKHSSKRLNFKMDVWFWFGGKNVEPNDH